MSTQLSSGLETIEARRHARMTALRNSFPSLRGKPGTDPWDQEAFARWAGGPARTSGSGAAAAFVLSAWNGCASYSDGSDAGVNEGEFHVGRFDVVAAFGVWDSAHVAAFIRWCNDPFWP